MLLYISVYHEFIKRAIAFRKFPKRAKISRESTIITFIVIVLAQDILTRFGNLAENNRAFYEFMIYRNVQ